MHRDGFGFVIADDVIAGAVGDIYIPPESARKAMNGDRILVRITRIGNDGRAEGRIVQVLDRAHETVVGEFRLGRRGSFVIPRDERIRQWIEIPSGLEIPAKGPETDRVGVVPPQVADVRELDGMIVDVQILEHPDETGRAVGRVTEILGRPDEVGVDVEIVIRKYYLPHRFPPDVLEQAQQLPKTISGPEISERRDFRELDVVTIDGETAKDFDDAVWVSRLPNGHYSLHVHIADVGHYVRPGTPIDREARLRGTSAYFPDRAVPMLPLDLSTDLCSLIPGSDRLVLSVLLEIDPQGDVVGQDFVHGVIRSRERMTYTNTHLLLKGDSEQRVRYAPLAESFELMRELAQVLHRKRHKRGSVDFDLPEPLIEFDEWGEMTGVTRAPRNIALRIIEEFMLAANEAVACHLEHLRVPSIYRIHEPPEQRRVLEFEEAAAHFGCSLGTGAVAAKKPQIVDRKRDGRKIRKNLVLPDTRLSVSSRHYQRLLKKIEGKPEERILNYLMLRSLKQARYHPENSGHFALALPTYTHFTSPIRRYPDLVVHRILSAVVRGVPGTAPPIEALHAIAEECSMAERRAADAERELVEWKKIKYMAGRLGDEFEGLIITTTKFGFFVELTELFVEGLVPIETLPGGKYNYQENTRRIVGERTRRQFSVGDGVKVRLDRVDGVERKLQFSLVTRR